LSSPTTAPNNLSIQDKEIALKNVVSSFPARYNPKPKAINSERNAKGTARRIEK
jgi:hypothetical protein